MAVRATIVACVPCIFADFPRLAWERSKNRYTRDVCDECKSEIWLGENSKVFVEETGTPKVCVFCAATKYGAGAGDKMTPLTGREQ